MVLAVEPLTATLRSRRQEDCQAAVSKAVGAPRPPGPQARAFRYSESQIEVCVLGRQATPAQVSLHRGEVCDLAAVPKRPSGLAGGSRVMAGWPLRLP